MNRVTATIMSSTFLSVANAISWSGFFILLAIVCLIILGWMYVYLPETKGRALEDMSQYFAEITGDRSIIDAEHVLRQPDETTTALTPMPIKESKPRKNQGNMEMPPLGEFFVFAIEFISYLYKSPHGDKLRWAC